MDAKQKAQNSDFLRQTKIYNVNWIVTLSNQDLFTVVSPCVNESICSNMFNHLMKRQLCIKLLYYENVNYLLLNVYTDFSHLHLTWFHSFVVCALCNIFDKFHAKNVLVEGHPPAVFVRLWSWHNAGFSRKSQIQSWLPQTTIK